MTTFWSKSHTPLQRAQLEIHERVHVSRGNTLSRVTELPKSKMESEIEWNK